VYLYYGNGGAQPVSSGDATFALFDHFEGTTINTTKWTPVNSPTIGNSAITLNGAGKLIKSTTQFGTNYAVSFYGTLYRDSWHIVGLGNSNSLGAPSSISIVGSYPNTGTYNARNFITGTDTGVNIGNGYSGNHVWTIARNGNQNNQFYVDSDLKTTISTGFTTSPLNVMIEQYPTITTGTSVFDWVFVRKYAESEPGQGVWNSQEINTIPPGANFTSDRVTGMGPFSVQFNETSSGLATSRQWNFGDGTANSTVQNPVHVYANAGTYTVTLTATNAYGSSSIRKANYVTVTPPPPFMNGWQYRKLHMVSGSSSGDLTDYQVRFIVWNTTGTDNGENVYVGPSVKPDYSDIRVTGFDNTLYPIWIQQVNTSAAVVWVKIPSIPSTGTQVYLYYGNGGAQPVSSGDATFALFDHFEGTTINTTKWTSVNSPTISNSAITLNGAGKLIKSTSQFGTNYAVSFYGTLYRDSWHIVGLGNSNSLGNPSSISLVGSYPNAGTYNARNLISGADSGVNIGNSYSGNHIWTVARNGDQNNQFYVDSDPKATITSGLTTLPLNVMIEEYPTITTGSSVFDWVLIRKYAGAEPGQGVWNSQEINTIGPSANFSSDKVTGMGLLSVQFNDTSSGISTSWQWQFGDGSSNSTERNPVHVYSNSGTYSVTLTSTNTYGSSSIRKANYVMVTPPPAFLNGWQYRKMHTISGSPSGDQTDYQVRFTVWNTTGTDNGENVYIGQNSKSDYSDIRVTGLDNIAYPIWIQQVNASAAVVWAKIPSIPSTGTQVYVYYGNGEAPPVSSGDATFALFDHFEGTTISTTKWTSVNSPTISNSAITLNGAGKLIKSTSQFGTNYAVSFYGTLYRDSWHIVGLGNSNSLGNPSSISLVGSYPNAGTYNARNFITGTDTGVNIGNGYSGNHVWTIARNGNQNNQFYVDSDLKTTITSGLTTLPLNVMIEQYPTITTGTSVFDWVFVRKYVGSEPGQGVWNGQEINTI
jgi:PKD repeat protein